MAKISCWRAAARCSDIFLFHLLRRRDKSQANFYVQKATSGRNQARIRTNIPASYSVSVSCTVIPAQAVALLIGAFARDVRW
jgi:hypothetical protein